MLSQSFFLHVISLTANEQIYVHHTAIQTLCVVYDVRGLINK